MTKLVESNRLRTDTHLLKRLVLWLDAKFIATDDRFNQPKSLLISLILVFRYHTMTSTAPDSTSSVYYPRKTLDRADRAVRCAPFRLKLYASMMTQSVSLTMVSGAAGLQNQYTKRPVTELVAEGELLWLIQVGLLRREVDGQGLTDSFRLTPLGRQLVSQWQTAGGTNLRPSLSDRFYNAVSRWLRSPF